MMTNNSRMWTLLAVLVLSIALGASPAIAQPVIEEVQVVDSGGDPLGDAELLLIFGRNFGVISDPDTPVIFLGTETDTPLVIAADQSFCSDALNDPPPPLDEVGTECVVAELPEDTPCGDYLLSIVGSGSCEDGKVDMLVFRYTGDDCSNPNNTQIGVCTSLPATPYLVVG